MIPSYYCAIIMAIVASAILKFEPVSDMFGLGWLRYFLGINMLLPSNSYFVWNNAYGWWTMSCFLCFYALCPIILRFVNNFIKSCCFVEIAFAVAVFWKTLNMVLFQNFTEIDALDVLCGGSPFGTLFQFAVGILVYFGIKEGKKNHAIIFCALFMMLAAILEKNHLGWCGICGLLIIALNDMPLGFSKIFKWLADKSYYVYLVHLLAIKIATTICNSYIASDKYSIIMFYLIFLIILIFSCFILNIVDKTVLRIQKGINDGAN